MPTQMIAIRTIKNMQTLSGAEGHNTRTHSSPNVDIERSHLNEELVSLPKDVKSYRDFYEKRIESSPYYDKSIPENSRHYIGDKTVKAVEIIFNISEGKLEDKVFNEWRDKTAQFVVDKFGKENVPQIVLHKDETTPHIHAMVIPMTKDGKLSFGRIGSTKKDIWKLREEYDKYVGELGIKMPARMSGQINFERINQFRENTIKKIEDISLSPPHPGENIQAYYERANKEHVVFMDRYVYVEHQLERDACTIAALDKTNRIFSKRNDKQEKKIEELTAELDRQKVDFERKFSEKSYDLKKEGKIELLMELGCRNVQELHIGRDTYMEVQELSIGSQKLAKTEPEMAQKLHELLTRCLDIGEKEMTIMAEMAARNEDVHER